jgi:hypothetical protein
MAPNETDTQGTSTRDTSHQGNWFCLPGRNTWHVEAHREYGVIWSTCGLRALAAKAETRGDLEEEEGRCSRCAGP